jgi:hypothetical protein
MRLRERQAYALSRLLHHNPNLAALVRILIICFPFHNERAADELCMHRLHHLISQLPGLTSIHLHDIPMSMVTPPYLSALANEANSQTITTFSMRLQSLHCRHAHPMAAAYVPAFLNLRTVALSNVDMSHADLRWNSIKNLYLHNCSMPKFVSTPSLLSCTLKILHVKDALVNPDDLVKFASATVIPQLSRLRICEGGYLRKNTSGFSAIASSAVIEWFEYNEHGFLNWCVRNLLSTSLY